MVANHILDKEEEDVITDGNDDFTKVAGYEAICGKADQYNIQRRQKENIHLASCYDVYRII